LRGAVQMLRVTVIGCGVLLAGTVGVYSFMSRADRADFAYVNSGGINTLDPAAITWKQDIRVALNIWEGLTTYDPKTSEPVEGAAFFPEVSDDGLTQVFTIRPDARWSNGDPVTADDFVRGWRRAIEPGTAADYAFYIADHMAGARAYYEWRNAAVDELSSLAIESPEWKRRFAEHAAQRDGRFAQVGLRAMDARRLEVRLERPCSYFLDLCAFATLLPIHASIELLRTDYNGTGITREGLVVYDPQWTKPDYHKNRYPGLITNGPYVVEAWTFKRRLRMKANPCFRDRDRLGCRTIDMLVHRDLNTAIMAYEAGDLDFLPEMSVSYDHELARLAMTGARADLSCARVFGTYYYLFNCVDETVDGRANPFVDGRVRKAFALAVNKRVIAEKVAGRGETPTDSIVPIGSIKDYESPSGLGYNPDHARRVLADAGYPAGVGLGLIDLLYNTGFDHGKICDVLAEMWQRELGATVVPRGKEVKTFAEDRKNRRFMIARAGWYGDYADPTTFLDVFVTGNGNNDSGHTDAKFDALMRQAAQSDRAGSSGQDPPSDACVAAPLTKGGQKGVQPRRLGLLQQAEARLIRETVPVLPLYQYTQLLAIKPYVEGLHPNPRLIFPFRYLQIRR